MAWRRRKTVIALLGMPLSFPPLGETFTTDLNHGDLYIMGMSSNILYVTLSTRGRRVPYTPK